MIIEAAGNKEVKLVALDMACLTCESSGAKKGDKSIRGDFGKA